jgi:phosphotriesterase-related protein
VIVSHIDSLEYAQQMLRRGANLSIDHIGTKDIHEDEHWIHIVSNLVQMGYVHQIMLSHDAVTFVYASEALPVKDAFGDYTYIARVFLPKLKQAGVTDEQISIMLEENTQRVLTINP